MWEILKNEYFAALSIIVLSIILANFIVFFLRKVVGKFVKKTKSELDDKLLDLATPQIYTLLIFIGFYFAVKSLEMLSNYHKIIDDSFFVILVVILAFSLSRIVRLTTSHWLHAQKKLEKTPQLISKIINAIIYLVAFLLVLDHFEISITPLIATLGVGAVAIGLALQGTLSNLFAGMRVISDNQINLGDFIELDNGISGYVEDIRWSSTTIHTLPNTIVVVPNSKIAESVITNYSMPQQETAVIVQCGVSYESNLEKVEKVTTKVAEKIQKTIPGAVKSFKPFIRYHTFGDSNINFSIILRAEKVVDKYLITHEFMKALKTRYDKEKIEISWPVRKIVKG